MTESQKHAQALLGWIGEKPEERAALRREAREWLKEIAKGKRAVMPKGTNHG